MNVILFAALTLGQSQPFPSYTKANQVAAKDAVVLVTFVGCPPRQVKGASVAKAKELDGFPDHCIVISYGDGSQLYWRSTLSANATDAEIERQVSPRVASPFPSSSGKRQGPLTADDDNLATGPWPMSVAKPEGLQRYKRAQYTQEIAVTNDRDRITPVHRLALDPKWHQSGGMEGVTAYRSDLYRLFPFEPRAYVGNIGVLNSFGHIQQNRGWRREFPDGTRFDDVLSNTETGKVFEHRMATKSAGVWTRKVIFRDEAHRPAGYVGLTQTCSSCHDAAGSGGYAVGLVPGSDTVLSFPFSALE